MRRDARWGSRDEPCRIRARRPSRQRFYTDVLGFRSIVDDPDGQYVFMRGPDSSNHHDIAFFTIGDQAGPSEAGLRTPVGMYHIAWEVRSLDELDEMRSRLAAAGARRRQRPRPEQEPLRQDPDGLEFEVMWLTPASTWGDEEHEAVIEPLDLEAAKRKYAEHGT